jgi:hypothetical protein
MKIIAVSICPVLTISKKHYTLLEIQKHKLCKKKNHTTQTAIMTLIYVKDEKMTMKSLCNMIDKVPEMDTFKLEHVELDGTEGDIIEFSKALRGHQYLEEFHLINVTLTDASLNLDQVVSLILVTVPYLHLVKLEKAPVSSSALAGASYCASLKTVLVPNSSLGDKDAVELAKAVSASPSIELVDISGNDISDLGCVAFLDALKKNTSVKTIRLEGNGKISGSHLTLMETALVDRAGGMTQAA